MNKLTKQGVRDLNDLGGGGSKSHLNGRKDRGQDSCFHVFEECFDEEYSAFRKCQRCGYEEV